jgi:hypothetical protein
MLQCSVGRTKGRRQEQKFSFQRKDLGGRIEGVAFMARSTRFFPSSDSVIFRLLKEGYGPGNLGVAHAQIVFLFGRGGVTAFWPVLNC